MSIIDCSAFGIGDAKGATPKLFYRNIIDTFSLKRRKSIFAPLDSKPSYNPVNRNHLWPQEKIASLSSLTWNFHHLHTYTLCIIRMLHHLMMGAKPYLVTLLEFQLNIILIHTYGIQLSWKDPALQGGTLVFTHFQKSVLVGGNYEGKFVLGNIH